MGKFAFTCQACGSELEIDDESRGEMDLCPHCQAAIKIPLVRAPQVRIPEEQVPTPRPKKKMVLSQQNAATLASAQDAQGKLRAELDAQSAGSSSADARVEAAWHAADCLLVDGTCWTDDEMSRRGIAHKRAREMGHLPQSGPGGMIEQLARFPDKRRVLIHINNTNPILDEDSPERAELGAAGIEVSFDGMEIEL